VGPRAQRVPSKWIWCKEARRMQLSGLLRDNRGSGQTAGGRPALVASFWPYNSAQRRESQRIAAQRSSRSTAHELVVEAPADLYG
jgi:hypothetical protein